eukprot:TRINITY_DN6302_c0_g1_i2.p1 TRINITY_DN6302_c0_g1~~TRINITY_DN6302_c0_g1_i2.p1  ORF type:complete len:302 (-),score=60.37 TRINITY_DN6302_c0_g1_i2:128-1033(-)
MENRVFFTIYRNSKNPGEGKTISISSDCTFGQLLDRISEKIGFKAKRLFKANGEEITDFRYIDEDDIIYVSQGESFALTGIKSTEGSRQRPVSQNSLIRESSIRLDKHVPSAFKFRLAVIGPAAVGKSALTIQYTKKFFVEDYINTIEDEHKTIVNVDGHLCEVNITDTAGLEDFVSMRQNWIMNSEAIILVYSVERQTFLEELDNFYRIYSISNPERNKPLILICNKIDLEKRAITTEEGQAVAAKYKAEYFECSAKFNIAVDDAFNHAIRVLLKRRLKERDANKSQTQNTSFWSWCQLI